MRKPNNLKPHQIQDIISRYPHEKAIDIANDYKVNIYLIYKTANRYGIKKSDEFKNSENSGRIKKGNCLSPETQYKKGHVGNTKGMRIEAIIKNEEKLRHWREQCLWKPGHKPHNTGKDGDIRFRINVGYWFIRISENNWEFYHRWLWIQKNGEIPNGYNIVFKQGFDRTQKPEIDDLECISDAELGERNRITKYPIELRNLIKTNNKLIRTINEYEKST